MRLFRNPIGLAVAVIPAALLLAGGLTRSAHAQLLFNLTPASANASAGGSATYTGTFTNSGSQRVYLTDLEILLQGAGISFLTPNTDPFLTNAPVFLDPGATTASPISLFTITSAANTPSGTYFGQAKVKGGAASGAVDDLATQGFQLVVDNNAALIPEASTGMLVPLGIAGLLASAAITRRRRAAAVRN